MSTNNVGFSEPKFYSIKLRYDVRPVYTAALTGLDLTYLPQLYLDRLKSWLDEIFGRLY